MAAGRTVCFVGWLGDKCLDQHRKLGMGGYELSKDADPLAHIARVQVRGGAAMVGGVFDVARQSQGDREVKVRICEGLAAEVEA